MQSPLATFRIWFGVFLALVPAPALTANTVPTISQLPQVSASTLVADDTTQYTVTMTASDADGYSDLRFMRVLFNYTEAGGDQTQGRGYMNWGKTDADITQYGGIWVIGDATGDGRWGYRTDAWGGTTYITPLSCSTTTAGSPTGGTGSRTVTWTFTVKPAWASNPVVNDADGTASDASASTGWRDGTFEFDVVAGPCNNWTTTPRAPVVSAVTASTLNVAIDPSDSSSNTYAIRVSPTLDGKVFVQSDGTLGFQPVWKTRSGWGTKTVAGLLSSTTYALTVKAINNSAGYCPSTYGPAATTMTLIQTRTIDTTATGAPISRNIIGNATNMDPGKPAAYEKLWAVVNNTAVRGIVTGLDGDTYNWKDMSGACVGHTGSPGPNVQTTLSWLQRARDHNSTAILTVNCRGTGPLSASGCCSFYYTDTSVTPLAALAADWVRYANFILRDYRQGDVLPPADQAIVDSINWYGRPKLLAPGESSTSQVIYWEIGNEPEVALPWCTQGATKFSPTPADYADRYKQITEAMVAVDPTIKVGPCITTASAGNNAHLQAVLSDHTNRVDFISYHPYGSLDWYANTYGDTESSAESGLRYLRQQQVDAHAGIVAAITASGRNPADIELVASEYNPSNWPWSCSPQIRRVSHALGLAETLWTFADLGLSAATYWVWPCWCEDGTETPGYKVFQMMQGYLGSHLLDSFTDGGNFRMYTARDNTTGRVILVALNFSQTADKPMQLSLTNLGVIDGVRLRKLANLTGETGLFDSNDPPASAPPLVDWTEQDVTGLYLSNFQITFDNATATMLVIDQHKAARADFDRDGDVDQQDFGVLQSCLGVANPSADPICAQADLNGDNAVNHLDVNRFKGCMSGSKIPANVNCASGQ